MRIRTAGRMGHTWRLPLLSAAILALALASGWILNANARERRILEYQDHQLHSIATISASVEAGMAGVARSLRLLATATVGRADADARALLERERQCSADPCASAITLYAEDGAALESAATPVRIGAQAVASLAAWARDPAHTGQIHCTIAESTDPSLVMVTPRRDPDGAPAGFVAEEITFDSLFERTKPGEGGVDANALLIVSGRGEVMFRTGHPEMRLNNLFTRGVRCAGCHQSLAHVDRMLQTKQGTLRYTVSGNRRLAAVSPISFEGESWMAAAIAPESSAVALVSTDLRQFAAIGGLTLVALGFVAHVGWRDHHRRLEEEARTSNRLTQERSHAALKSMNARLESAADEWRTTVDAIDAAVIVLDPTGPIERMNRVAAELLPGETFSWLGQPSASLASLSPWQSALALAAEAIERDTVAMSRLSDAATGKTWDLWCRAPKRPNHRRRSVVVVARDVTALVELQASVRRSETMAALGLVVAGVAHEVRNPLFAISSLVDAWALAPQSAPPRVVDALRGEVGRLKTLMTELLEYGSASTSELAPVRLAPLIDDAIAACRHEIETRAVRVTASVGFDGEVWIDAKRFMRVLINLIENAVQHSPAGSVVTCTVTSEARGVRIEVRDTGQGFAPDDLPKLFTPFFSRRQGGFGLGLAICERIVGEHGGDLVAGNHPDGGAVMTIMLPVGAPPFAARSREGEAPC